MKKMTIKVMVALFAISCLMILGTGCSWNVQRHDSYECDYVYTHAGSTAGQVQSRPGQVGQTNAVPVGSTVVTNGKVPVNERGRHSESKDWSFTDPLTWTVNTVKSILGAVFGGIFGDASGPSVYYEQVPPPAPWPGYHVEVRDGQYWQVPNS